MATIMANGSMLLPQPARATWDDTIIDQVLDGTQAVGAFRTLRISAPKLVDQAFNWGSFENQVLSSLQAFAPGDRPTGPDVVYSSGVVARKIKTYQMPEDRTVTGVELEILVVV
jgi:hypothetical protein